MTAIIAFLTKWWPVVSTLAGLVASIVGTHNHAALLAGAQESSAGGVPVLGGGVLAVVMGILGYVRNVQTAQQSFPPSVLPSNSTEDQVIGTLASIFATKRDARLSLIPQLFRDSGTTPDKNKPAVKP